MRFKNGSRNACVSIPSEMELDVAVTAFQRVILEEDPRRQCHIAARLEENAVEDSMQSLVTIMHRVISLPVRTPKLYEKGI